MDLGKQIAYFRKHKDITQDALAKLLGISNQAVSKWENGQSCPDIELLPKIADVFGITLDELFERNTAVSEASVDKLHSLPGEDAMLSLPWEDDEKLRAVVFIGRKLIQRNELQDNVKCICKEITIHYGGTAKNIESSFNVSCEKVEESITAGGYVQCGDVGGSITAGDFVQCGNVEEGVTAGDYVECCNVGGGVTAGDYVECSDVGGSVTAGDYVGCGDVGGSVTAGDYVECGDVEGTITSGSYIECGDVQGNVRAEGNVCCGDVGGKVEAGGCVECGDIDDD